METDATYRGTVYPWQCDHVGHMNIMWYVGKFDEANWNLFARLGLTPSYLRESGRGMAAVQQTVAYKRELLAGDIVEVRSRLLEIRDKSIRFVHEMRNAETGEIAATCEFIGVHMDRQARKSTPFAPAIRDAAKSISNRRWRERMSRFEPKNPDYRAIAIAHVRAAAGDEDARHFDRAAGAGRGRSGDGLFAPTSPSSTASSMPGSSPQVSTMPAASPPSR